MFLDDPVNKVIRALVRTLLGLPEGYVRPANQTNAPAGSKEAPFATVYLSTCDQEGSAVRTQTPDPQVALNLIETSTAVYHAVASVQFFRAGANSKARELNSALWNSDAIEYMQAQNIGYMGSGPVLDVTAVVDTFYEERAKVDLEFYVTVVTSISLPTFGTFPMTVKMNNSSLTFEVSEPS